MACGAPVVTSRSSSLVEVAGDAALLVDPLSVDEIAGALHEIHCNPGLHAELSRRGLKRAGLFTWETSARSTLDVYERVVRTKAALQDNRRPVLGDNQSPIQTDDRQLATDG
jgi:glycosyltransferase involved in cell wall biosynthesis